MSVDRRQALLALLSLGPAGALAAPGTLPSPPDARTAMNACCPIVELRQYTLHRGQRDVLIALFESAFIEPQNEVGARLIGQFRDLDDPDRFVWLRGFESMPARAAALAAFYGGPVWKANRAAANATIVDSDNVLLLHPLHAGEGFDLPAAATVARGGLVAATIHYVDPGLASAFADFFAAHLQARIEAHGATLLAVLVSETSANTFPGLPVRSGDHALIWFARFPDEIAHRRFVEAMQADTAWREAVPEALLPAFMRKPETLRLRPTDLSPLR